MKSIFFVGGISIGKYVWANVNERKIEIRILNSNLQED